MGQERQQVSEVRCASPCDDAIDLHDCRAAVDGGGSSPFAVGTDESSSQLLAVMPRSMPLAEGSERSSGHEWETDC